MTRRKKAKKRVATRRLYAFYLVVFGLAAGLTIAELGLRFYGAIVGIDFRLYLKELQNSNRLPGEVFRQSATRGWELAPQATALATTSDFSVVYHVNEDGLRDRSSPLEKPPGEHRIIALGDSFTFGEGIPYGKRFVDFPEHRIPNTNVITLAVPGYGLDQEVLLFREKGLKYHPDELVLFLNEVDIQRWTGIFDSTGTEIKFPAIAQALDQSSTNTIYLKRSDPFFLQKSYWGLSHSQLFGLVSYQWNRWRLVSKLRATDASVWGVRVASSPPKTATVRAPASDQAPPSDRASGVSPEVKLRTLNLLRGLEKICAERHIKFSIINIDGGRTFPFLKELSPATSYLDLSGDLVERRRHVPLSFVYDKHFNPSTHRFIGEAFAKFLLQKQSAL